MLIIIICVNKSSRTAQNEILKRKKNLFTKTKKIQGKNIHLSEFTVFYHFQAWAFFVNYNIHCQ